MPARPSKCKDHWKLESNAECENQAHHQPKIFADLGQKRDFRLAVAALLHPQREPDQHRHDDEVDHRRAHDEENRGGYEVRQKCLPLVAIKTWGDEFVDLRRHDWKRDEQRRRTWRP